MEILFQDASLAIEQWTQRQTSHSYDKKPPNQRDLVMQHQIELTDVPEYPSHCD